MKVDNKLTQVFGDFSANKIKASFTMGNIAMAYLITILVFGLQ